MKGGEKKEYEQREVKRGERVGTAEDRKNSRRSRRRGEGVQ